MSSRYCQIVVGGIGDLILSIDSIREDIPLCIRTHSNIDTINKIIIDLGVHKDPYTISMETMVNINYNTLVLPKEPFTRWTVPSKEIDRIKNSIKDINSDKKKIIIHPFGSNWSKSFALYYNLPQKNIPVEIIDNLSVELRKNHILYIAGTKEELLNYNCMSGYNIHKIVLEDTWTGIALASLCNAMIGSDSSIKTFTASKRIPSFVFVGAYEDKIRDDIFINPYIKENVIRKISLVNYENICTDLIVTEVNNKLK